MGLLQACENGQHEIVSFLLGNDDIDLSQSNSRGLTPLMLSCQNGHHMVASLLLGCSNVDINQAGPRGWTVLMYACHNGHNKVASLILGHHGVDVNQTDDDGWTALMRACDSGHDKVVSALLGHDKVNVNKSKDDGFTALTLACYNGHRKIVELLLQYGVNVNQVDSSGRTALIYACKNGLPAVVSSLLDYGGVDVNVQPNLGGRTALSQASYNGHAQIVSLLLDHGDLDINQAGPDGWTALMQACFNGRSGIVSLLLDNDNLNGITKDDGIAAHFFFQVARVSSPLSKLLLESEPVLCKLRPFIKSGLKRYHISDKKLMKRLKLECRNVTPLALVGDPSFHFTALSLARLSNNVDTYLRLLASSADWKDEINWSMDHPNWLSTLLDNCPSAFDPFFHEGSNYHLSWRRIVRRAITNTSETSLELLIRNGGFHVKEGEHPIHWAIESGQPRLVRIFANTPHFDPLRFPDDKIRRGVLGSSQHALSAYLQEGMGFNLAALEKLLDKNGDALEDPINRPGLLVASGNGDWKAVECMVRRYSVDGMLKCMERYGSQNEDGVIGMFQYLVTSNGVAAHDGKSLELLQRMCESEVLMDAADSEGKFGTSAVQVCSVDIPTHIDQFGMLVSSGADVIGYDSVVSGHRLLTGWLGRHLLLRYAWSGDVSGIERLTASLEGEKTFLARDHKHRTALHFAAIHGGAKVVRVLLEKGMAADARDEDGWTPLHDAAGAGLFDVVHELFSNKRVKFRQIASARTYHTSSGRDGRLKTALELSQSGVLHLHRNPVAASGCSVCGEAIFGEWYYVCSECLPRGVTADNLRSMTPLDQAPLLHHHSTRAFVLCGCCYNSELSVIDRIYQAFLLRPWHALQALGVKSGNRSVDHEDSVSVSFKDVVNSSCKHKARIESPWRGPRANVKQWLSVDKDKVKQEETTPFLHRRFDAKSHTLKLSTNITFLKVPKTESEAKDVERIQFLLQVCGGAIPSKSLQTLMLPFKFGIQMLLAIWFALCIPASLASGVRVGSLVPLWLPGSTNWRWVMGIGLSLIPVLFGPLTVLVVALGREGVNGSEHQPVQWVVGVVMCWSLFLLLVAVGYSVKEPRFWRVRHHEKHTDFQSWDIFGKGARNWLGLLQLLRTTVQSAALIYSLPVRWNESYDLRGFLGISLLSLKEGMGMIAALAVMVVWLAYVGYISSVSVCLRLKPTNLLRRFLFRDGVSAKNYLDLPATRDVVETISSVLLIPLVVQCIEAHDCSYNTQRGAYVLDHAPTVTCWEGWHLLMSVVMLFMGAVFVMQAYVVSVIFEQRKDEVDIRFLPFYTIVEMTFLIVLAAVTTLFSSHPVFCLILTLVLQSILAIMCVTLHPTNRRKDSMWERGPCSVFWFNRIKAASHASMTVVAASALYSVYLDDPISLQPIIFLGQTFGASLLLLCVYAVFLHGCSSPMVRTRHGGVLGMNPSGATRRLPL